MYEEFRKKENDLLASLIELEAEASRYSNEMSILDQKLIATKLELNSVREKILDEFLFEHLSPLLLTYVIKVLPNGSIVLSIHPQPGGDLEFDKLRTSLGWPDMNNVPAFHVLSYLGKGIPWSSEDVSLNVT